MENEVEAEKFEKIINTQKATEIKLELRTGMKISAKVWGPEPSVVNVLAVHGWMDNANSFDLLAPFLAAHGMRVVCIDLIGHGRSPHHDLCTDYSYYDHICTIVDTAATLGWKSFSYMGHSMGGALGSILAASMPSLINHLVLLDTLGPFIPNVTILQSLTNSIQARPRSLTHTPHLYPSLEAAGEKLRRNNSYISERGLKLLLERSLYNVTVQNGSTGVMYSHDPRIRDPSPIKMREEDAIEMLQALKCPTLVIGSNVSFKTISEKNQIRISIFEQIGAEMLMVDGSHHVHLDNPEAFAGKLLNFLKKPKEPLLRAKF